MKKLMLAVASAVALLLAVAALSSAVVSPDAGSTIIAGWTWDDR